MTDLLTRIEEQPPEVLTKAGAALEYSGAKTTFRGYDTLSEEGRAFYQHRCFVVQHFGKAALDIVNNSNIFFFQDLKLA